MLVNDLLANRIPAGTMFPYVQVGYLTLVTNGNQIASGRVLNASARELEVSIACILHAENHDTAPWRPRSQVVVPASDVFFFCTAGQAQRLAELWWKLQELPTDGNRLGPDAPAHAYYNALYRYNESSNAGIVAAVAAGASPLLA